MEQLDPKAELMRLADEYSAQCVAISILGMKAKSDKAKAARATLESAITLALAAERRRALEDAAGYASGFAAKSIRALIDGKTSE